MRTGRGLALAALAAAAGGAVAASGDGRAAPQGSAWRSGNPPIVHSAAIDSQRRLVVSWTAPDGMTYGGSIYLDNDPANATPVTSGKYGTLMHCNNKGTCKGRWRLEANPGTGPFTYTTERLDATRFPAGTYYMQVEGFNEDPFPSTRLWEWSNIVTLTVPPVDTTPPETTITGGPSGTTSSTAASFTFGSSETPSTFECRLDGAAFGACTSPKDYSGLAGGAHTFEVRAIDAAGNADASPASRSWTIDTAAPETTITDGPTGTVTAKSATFAFTSSESPSTFECRLDGAAFAACTSPASYDNLAAGEHAFEVRAADAAGNVDATPAARSWTIRAAPSASAPAAQPGKAQPKRAQKRMALKVRRPEDNKTAPCGRALERIDRLEKELAKAVASWNFENRLTGNERVQETRLEQLDRRIDRLEAQLVDTLNDANRACGADWGGVWRGQGTFLSSECKAPTRVPVTLTIVDDGKKFSAHIGYELKSTCPQDAFPAIIRRNAVIPLGAGLATAARLTTLDGSTVIDRTGAETLRGKVVRTYAGIRLTLEFTAKRG